MIPINVTCTGGKKYFQLLFLDTQSEAKIFSLGWEDNNPFGSSQWPLKEKNMFLFKKKNMFYNRCFKTMIKTILGLGRCPSPQTQKFGSLLGTPKYKILGGPPKTQNPTSPPTWSVSPNCPSGWDVLWRQRDVSLLSTTPLLVSAGKKKQSLIRRPEPSAFHPSASHPLPCGGGGVLPKNQSVTPGQQSKGRGDRI